MNKFIVYVIWILLSFALLFIAYSRAHADPNLDAIHSAAIEVGISETALLRICTVESDLRSYMTGDDGWSHGLCQVQANTAIWMDNYYESVGQGRINPYLTPRTELIESLYNPNINALYSARYLRFCHDRYLRYDFIKAWRLTYACYNAGPGVSDKYQDWIQFLPKNVLHYIYKVEKHGN